MPVDLSRLALHFHGQNLCTVDVTDDSKRVFESNGHKDEVMPDCAQVEYIICG